MVDIKTNDSIINCGDIMERFKNEIIVIDKKGNFSSINKMNIFDNKYKYQINMTYEQFKYEKHITLEVNKYGYIYTLKHSPLKNQFDVFNSTDFKRIYYYDVLSYINDNYDKIMNFYKILTIYRFGI